MENKETVKGWMGRAKSVRKKGIKQVGNAKAKGELNRKKAKSVESRGERGLGGSLGLSRNNRDCQFWVALKHDRQIDRER